MIKIGAHVLVEQPGGVRFTGVVTRAPAGHLLGVVTEGCGQDRIVPHGSIVSRLHTYDDAEVRYVYTRDGDGRVWEIIERRWSCNNATATDAEMSAEGFTALDEEALREQIEAEEWEERNEGYYPPPDLTRLGREL